MLLSVYIGTLLPYHDGPCWSTFKFVKQPFLLPCLALQEMSPIDIVPMAPQAHEETFHDTTQSDVGFFNQAFSPMERLGTVPRRPTNGHVRHVSMLCYLGYCRFTQ